MSKYLINRLIYLAICGSAALAVAGGYIATPPPLARSLTADQIDKAVAEAPADTNVGVPAWYAAKTAAYRELATNELAKAAVPALGAVIKDSRANIPELAGLSDVQVAALYLRQMSKPVEQLQALCPTNNALEYLIGAGMRADIRAMQGGNQ